jgi:hypothetical protein
MNSKTSGLLQIKLSSSTNTTKTVPLTRVLYSKVNGKYTINYNIIRVRHTTQTDGDDDISPAEYIIIIFSRKQTTNEIKNNRTHCSSSIIYLFDYACYSFGVNTSSRS